MLRRYHDYQLWHKSKRKKFTEVQKRVIACHQAYRCASSYCSQQKLPETWELDHVRPLFLGGSNYYDFKDPSNPENNLQILCPLCHARKTQQEKREFLAQEKKHKFNQKKKPADFVLPQFFYKKQNIRKFHKRPLLRSPYFQNNTD